jgi:ferric-dicitrate binding protein FerR (iron transport regulator)
MAPTFPSVDNATLKALHKSDVSALERIHRAAYTALLAEAAHLGGDASYGPPVAELAMLTVWENRANMENAEELEQAIHAAVRGGVTREQRRRAAQKGGGAPSGAGTVDSTWAHVAAEIAKMPATSGARKHTEPKHHVEKVKSDGGRGGMIAVAVLLIGVAAVAGWYVMQEGAHGVATGSYTLPDAKNVSVTAGQRGNLPLGPGDTAAIGSDTRITVGGDYGVKVRAVKVDGSASFRVSTGPHFEVDAKDASIVTTGGAFAVRAYKDDPAIIVRVKEGEVKVDAAKESRTVAAGKAIAIAKDGTMSEPAPDAVDQALGWTEGKVDFTNTPLKVVMAELARWYDLPVTTKDTSLYSRPVTMAVALESKKDAIAALEESASVKFTYDKDSKPVLQDAPKKATTKPAPKAAAKEPAKKKGK